MDTFVKTVMGMKSSCVAMAIWGEVIRVEGVHRRTETSPERLELDSRQYQDEDPLLKSITEGVDRMVVMNISDNQSGIRSGSKYTS